MRNSADGPEPEGLFPVAEALRSVTITSAQAGTAAGLRGTGKDGIVMRAVVTRVSSASVTIGGRVSGAIGRGFLVLLGVGTGDTEKECDRLADKVCGLRVFEDENGKMNRNLEAVGGALLVVSQFTLYADCKSRRPGFTGAARPDTAVPLYERFLAQCAARGFPVEHGQFGADMQVESVNDGPVTLILDTDML